MNVLLSQLVGLVQYMMDRPLSTITASVAIALVIFATLGSIALIIRCTKRGEYLAILEDRLDRLEERHDRDQQIAEKQVTTINRLLDWLSRHYPDETEAQAAPQELLGDEIVRILVGIITKPGTERTEADFVFFREHWDDTWCLSLVNNCEVTVAQLESFANHFFGVPTPPDVADRIRRSLATLPVENFSTGVHRNRHPLTDTGIIEAFGQPVP